MRLEREVFGQAGQPWPWLYRATYPCVPTGADVAVAPAFPHFAPNSGRSLLPVFNLLIGSFRSFVVP
jgi:hypothetical protein